MHFRVCLLAKIPLILRLRMLAVLPVLLLLLGLVSPVWAWFRLGGVLLF